MAHRLNIKLVAESEDVVRQVGDDISRFLASHPEAARLKEIIVNHHVHVPLGSADDVGEIFDRQAARTSGQTVDVTAPGGVSPSETSSGWAASPNAGNQSRSIDVQDGVSDR